jgi:acyl transferase domain-containing protein/NADPH:quinone reductase-like Zn-dependent oxidoreductase
MSPPDNSRISPARLALAVKRLRANKENLDLIASDPIAIVGMGCRFPGAASPAEFWTALKEGRDCVGEIPAGRWKDAATLQPQMRRGAYLAEIDGFEAGYFGISPREAQHMDPQQRLLLEVTWEALWDAGIEPARLAGTDTGVFAAIYNSDYARLHFRDTSQLTAHAGIGAAHSVAAGRLSFLLNVKGPCLAIDSACSSSLVATHLACQSLRARECGVAIVAASSLKLLSDEVLVFSKWGMLASDGKCKTFDANADGFVPGEGCGVLVLKRLSDALQDGDRVRAVIRGTAVNHDGRTTVLTAPNGLAQEAVLRAALKNAMLDAREVSYVETHGTGTALGDPIEIEAVRAVYGDRGAVEQRCVLGAVKTNLGHLEAAAGMAGFIKTVLCLEQDEIPKNLHFRKLNPEISIAGSRLAIPTENVPWARSDRPRIAGVSSFGLGGTNGHILVEEAPLVAAGSSTESRRTIPLTAHVWKRQRFWLEEPPKSKRELLPENLSGAVLHPLLGREIDSPFVKGRLFASYFNMATSSYLAEHRLGERAIAPFAAFLEIAAAAARQADPSGNSAIRNFAMHEPRFLSSEPCGLQVLVAGGSFEIASRYGSGWKTNAVGTFGSATKEMSNAEIDRLDLSGLRTRCACEISPAEIYRRLERTGLRYGTAFRTIQSAWSGGGESIARLKVADTLRSEASEHGLHPTLLDGCLQSVIAARGDSGDDLFLPISLDCFEMRRTGLSEVWVHTKIVASSDRSVSAEIAIADCEGIVVARLIGFTAKRVEAELLGRVDSFTETGESTLTYEVAWRPSPPSTDELPAPAKKWDGERWLLVEQQRGTCGMLTEFLTREGAFCEVVQDGEFAQAALQQTEWTGIVYDTRGSEIAETLPWSRPEKNAVEFVFKFAESLKNFTSNARRLWMLTSGTAAVLPCEDVSIGYAPLCGLVRTLALEHPEASPVLIDFGPSGAGTTSSDREAQAMLEAEMCANGAESAVAFRNGKRYAARLSRSKPSGDFPRRLAIDASGRLEDLRMEPGSRREPGPQEIEIEVRASGLNFRDVLTAMGMLPARGPEHGPAMGAECSGTVARIGMSVRGWEIGDNVLAFAPFSLQTFVTVPAEFVTRKPDAMTFAEAAGIPVAFLTAKYGLHRLANLTAGQRILIHAAAGGLGLAAVQTAMRAGAQVFATAGSPEKREFLKRLGVQHVFDSRSLAFRDQVLAATGGAGVDVVLNSLAGDFIGASFDTLAPGGCFLEVGKRGIQTKEEVESLGKSIRYFPFDLGDVAMENPALIAEMLRELLGRFASGELKPLPTAVYPVQDAADAFRTMAQARHIGKIVFSFNEDVPQSSVRDLVSNGTVLITGGLGALGLETARWLAALGAKSIVLAGRSAPEKDNHAIVEELRQSGVEVALERVDVADSDDLQRLLKSIRATKPPLRAVFHAAGVVQDSVLGGESWRNYRAATAAKIDGAWNLHQLTQDDPIACMVFFSSAAAIFGSPGQGSYAAGNAFLDALAHYRANRGLRTLSVDWGAWASAGMAARLAPEQAARWQRRGVRPMQPGSALSALEKAIESGRSQVAILDMDWNEFFADGLARRDAAFVAELRAPEPRKEITRDSAGAEKGILELLRSAPAADRKFLVSAHVKACARRALGLEESTAIAGDIPLQEIGLDSLMALEMRNELAQSLGVPLTAGLLFDYPAVDALTTHLLGLLPDLEAKETGALGKIDSGPLLADLKSLSEEEAEDLLIQELDGLRKEKANA